MRLLSLFTRNSLAGSTARLTALALMLATFAAGSTASGADPITYTYGSTNPVFDYGTPTPAAPAATGDTTVLSNTQVSARGSFIKPANLLDPVGVEYGLGQSYGTIQPVTTAIASSPEAGTPAFFALTLDGLEPGATYYYRTRVVETITDPATGSTTTQTHSGEERTFTMSPLLPRGPVWCSDAPITFNAITIATGGNVPLNATPHLVEVTQGVHGATTINGANVLYTPGPSFAEEDAIRVKIGFTSNSSFPFPASPPPASYVVEVKIRRPSLPVATTGSAIIGSNSEVQVNATFSANGPNAVASFEYGTDKNYGTTRTPYTVTGPSGVSIVPSVVLSELQPGTTYHYRARLVNSVGETLGEDATFTTPDAVDGGTYVIDVGAFAFNAFQRINVPWDVPATGSAVQAASSLIIVIGPGNLPSKAVAPVTQGAHGSVTTDGTNITYTPGPTFAGSDSFLYRVVDGRIGAITIGQLPTNVPFWVRVEIRSVLGSTKIVAVKGGNVPGSSSTFAALGIAEPGSFAGTVQNGATKVSAILDADGSVKIKVGEAAPGLDGSSMVKLTAPSGQAALANLKIVPGLVTAANDCVLLGGLDGTPRVAVREGQALDNDATLRIKTFGTFDGNGSVIFFLATLQGMGVTAASDLALCAAFPDGTVRSLIREGSDFLGSRITTITTLVGAPGSLAEGRWRAGDDAIGVRATYPDRSQALFRFTVPSGGITNLADTTYALLPPPANATPDSFGLPAFGPNGTAFRANLAGSADVAIGVTTDVVAFTSTLLASKTGAVPNELGFGFPPEIHFASFGEPVAGAQGRTAFTGTLTGPGVTAANRSGIWYSPDGTSAKLLARTGDAARGGGRWASFTSLALPDGPTSAPLFTGTLILSAADSVTTANRLGLWGVDSTGILRLLLRTGQMVNFPGGAKKVTSFTALTSAAGSIGAAHGYDNAGHVSALVTFEDRTVAVVKLAVP